MRQRLLVLLPVIALFSLIFAEQALAAGIVIEDQPAFWDSLYLVLTNDIVRTVLLIVGIAGVVIEIATVGSFGVFGAVGVLSFVLYFAGSIWSGSMGLNSILLLIIGLILLLIEIFVVSGFGITGIAGIVCLLLSLIFASPNPSTAVWSVLVAFVISIAIIWFTLKNKKTRRYWQKLILSDKMSGEHGYSSADPSLSQYQDATGRAVTVLRPSGTAVFDGKRVDVVTQGEFINPGSQVKVVLIEGMRVVVSEIKDDAQANDLKINK